MVLADYYAPFGSQGPGFQLVRPEGLRDVAWRAISEPLARLNRALRDEDLPLVIGSAKELAEAVAKVVLAARGQSVGNREELPTLITKAQMVLDRQPGKGLAADTLIRDVAQGAKNIAATLPQLRNRYGTGHGRPESSEVAEELALVSLDAVMLWCRWALGRLRHLIRGRPDKLVEDLREAKFYRGDLADRLKAARLAELDEADQLLIATAVARRAMTGTFLVMDEGVALCAETRDLDQWPLTYRTGLINGLLLDFDGLLDANPWGIEQVALLAESLPEPGDFFDVMAEKCWHASYARRMDDDDYRHELRRAMSKQTRIPLVARPGWARIKERLEVPF